MIASEQPKRPRGVLPRELRLFNLTTIDFHVTVTNRLRYDSLTRGPTVELDKILADQLGRRLCSKTWASNYG